MRHDDTRTQINSRVASVDQRETEHMSERAITHVVGLALAGLFVTMLALNALALG